MHYVYISVREMHIGSAFIGSLPGTFFFRKLLTDKGLPIVTVAWYLPCFGSERRLF